MHAAHNAQLLSINARDEPTIGNADESRDVVWVHVMLLPLLLLLPFRDQPFGIPSHCIGVKFEICGDH
jgi:hypothetical protein